MDLGEPRWSDASGMSGITLHSEGLPRHDGWGGAEPAPSRQEATATWAFASNDLRSARCRVLDSSCGCACDAWLHGRKLCVCRHPGVQCYVAQMHNKSSVC